MSKRNAKMPRASKIALHLLMVSILCCSCDIIAESVVENAIYDSYSGSNKEMNKAEMQEYKTKEAKAEAKKREELKKQGRCPSCGGIGKTPDGKYTCATCNGTGKYTEETEKRQ